MPRERTIVARRRKCRTPHCNNDVDRPRREVCNSCYQSMYSLVTAGQVKWEELEEIGAVGAVTSTKSYVLERIVKLRAMKQS